MNSTIKHCGLLLAAVVLLTSVGSAQMRSGKFGIGAVGSLYFYQANYTSNAQTTFGGGLSASYSVIEHLGLRAMFSYGQLGWTQSGTGSVSGTYITNVFNGSLYVSGDLLPHEVVNPFIMLGVGFVYFDPRDPTGKALLNSTSIPQTDINYFGGIGVDIFANEFVSFTLSGEYAMTNTTWLHGFKSGSNDAYARGNLEIRYYFFDQDFITKLLKAMEARYKK